MNDTRAPAEERSVSVRGSSLHLWEGGSGPPLVFLHGAGSIGQRWVGAFPQLALRHRVLLPDLPGFGRSPDLPDLRTFTDLAAVVEEFLRQEVDGPVDLLGNSMGGGIAAGIALRSPELVRRLVLVAPGGLIEREDRHREAAQVRPGEVNRALFHRLERAQGEFPTLRPEEVRERWKQTRAVLDRWMRNGLEPLPFERIRSPTLVVWGREDRILPASWAEEIARRIPGARAVVLEDCGHVPQLELPREFCQAVEPFLGAEGQPRTP